MSGDNDSPVVLASSKSIQISLEAVRAGKAGLNEHRQGMLDRVPHSGTYIKLKNGAVDVKDLAYLSAATGVEFAILRSKKEDILFRGDSKNCLLDKELLAGLLNHKYRIEAHSHPGEPIPIPSDKDREALRRIGQTRSVIISGITGICTDFGQDPFELPGENVHIDVDGSALGGDTDVDL